MARVIFDLDGTLVDSASSLAEAANALLREFDRPPLTHSTIVGFVGNGMAKLVERVLCASGGIPAFGLDHSIFRFKQIYFSDPVTGTRAYPGVTEALSCLSQDGHGLAVCTQKPNSPSVTILKELELMPPIAGLTSGDSLDVIKPDPAMLWHAAEQLPEGKVIFVGDSEVDAATAHAAGVPFLLHRNGYCHVPHESLPADAIFDRYDELPALVQGLLEQQEFS